MRVLTAALLLIFTSLLLIRPPAQGSHSNTAASDQSLNVDGGCAEQQAFQFDLQPDTGNGPHFVVTNLCAERMTAFFLENFSPADGRAKGGQLWDALVPHRSPIAKDESLSGPLGHVADQPFTDKIEVAAVVWADGSTFGNPEPLKLILSKRTADLRGDERAISLLQKGLQQNWTRDKYLAAWDQQKKEAPITGAAAGIMESNLQKNPSLDSQRNLQRIMQHLLGMFMQTRDILRQSKPQLSMTGDSN